VGIAFTEKQKKGWEILTDSRKTRILFDGGSRSGKTLLLMEYLIARAFQFPGSRQLVARKHRAHVKQSIWNNTLKKYLAEFVPDETYSKSESELVVNFFNGSSIIAGGLDESERVEKILGNEYITVLLNEATQLSWNTVQMIITRLSQSVSDAHGRKGIPKLCMDCNPRSPRHWLYICGVMNRDPDSMKPLPDASKWARLSWSAYDNMRNLPEEYIKSLQSLPELMRARMLDGIWRSSEGSVYDEFNEDIHVVKPFEIPSAWKRTRAIDFGYTNPFVCLWGAIDNDGRLYIYREYYKSHVRTSTHAEKIREMTGDEHVSCTVADHDASERADLEAGGVSSENALKDVREGIQAVKNRLVVQGDGKARLFFFSGLNNVLSEMHDYMWQPQREGGNAKEEPVKENDHAMDALRYMVMSIDKKKKETRVASLEKVDNRWK